MHNLKLILCSKHIKMTKYLNLRYSTTGHITTAGRYKIVTGCQMDFAGFPFDTQKCDLKLYLGKIELIKKHDNDLIQ